LNPRPQPTLTTFLPLFSEIVKEFRYKPKGTNSRLLFYQWSWERWQKRRALRKKKKRKSSKSETQVAIIAKRLV
jgi:hypothetical protein